MEGFLTKIDGNWYVKYSDMHSMTHGQVWAFTPIKRDCYTSDFREDKKVKFKNIKTSYDEDFKPMHYAEIIIDSEYNRVKPAKNRIISIGYTGNMRCYLNLSKEESIERYLKSSNTTRKEFEDDLDITFYEYEFEDEFESYDSPY